MLSLVSLVSVLESGKWIPVSNVVFHTFAEGGLTFVGFVGTRLGYRRRTVYGAQV